jgi:hypothetical protein
MTQSCYLCGKAVEDQTSRYCCWLCEKKANRTYEFNHQHEARFVKIEIDAPEGGWKRNSRSLEYVAELHLNVRVLCDEKGNLSHQVC